MKDRKHLSQSFLTAVIISTLAFASGCATPSAHVAQQQATLTAAGVEPVTIAKVISYQSLELDDIIELNNKGIAASAITDAINQSRTAYQLNSEHLQQLQKAEVDNSIIDALLASPHRITPVPTHSNYYYQPSYNYPHYNHGYHPYHHGRNHYRCY